MTTTQPPGIHDPAREISSCGVGFITRKDGLQSHDVLLKGNEALCSVPHRGGMSAEGVGDGAGVNLDLSLDFFRKVTGREDLAPGTFGVGNFFVSGEASAAIQLIGEELFAHGLVVVHRREVPVDVTALRPAAIRHQLPILQWIFMSSEGMEGDELERRIHAALLAIEERAFAAVPGLYPLSMSSRTQVLKGRLSAPEVFGYFDDLRDPDHRVRTLVFHTRFSTNTDPHPSMAQPFRLLAHNGELNTDRKNRISDEARARARGERIVRPPGQSDSSRLDQTLHARVVGEGTDLVTAVVAMMPPAWENDASLDTQVHSMLEYFALVEEINDGPAALIFHDGTVVGARLDRLGLRPLRVTETTDYLFVTSEAGQVVVTGEQVLRQDRIPAGGMIHFDHATGTLHEGGATLRGLARQRDYRALVEAGRVQLSDLPAAVVDGGSATPHPVSYGLHQESLRFLLDPMLTDGAERISAMGYGVAGNALNDAEPGLSRYFSQRFAQVTNPPLDSVRESIGMSLRVVLGARPDRGGIRQIVADGPILSRSDLARLEAQDLVPNHRVDLLFTPAVDRETNAAALEAAVEAVCEEVATFVAREGGIVVLGDGGITDDLAPIPLLLAVAAVIRRLITDGLAGRASLVVDSGQIVSSHDVATALGFGAAAMHPRSVVQRAGELFPADPDAAVARFTTAVNKALLKTMARVGLCTLASYTGGEFFEPNFLDTGDGPLARWFPTMTAPVGGVGFAQLAESAAQWHRRGVGDPPVEPPPLGLFKERADGPGHTFGSVEVRAFEGLAAERSDQALGTDTASLRRLTLQALGDAHGLGSEAYRVDGFAPWSPAEINGFTITAGYRAFVVQLQEKRRERPAGLRDVLALPADIGMADTAEEVCRSLTGVRVRGNASVAVRGLDCRSRGNGGFVLRLTSVSHSRSDARARLMVLAEGLRLRCGTDLLEVRVGTHQVEVLAQGEAAQFLALLVRAPDSIDLAEVQPASEITPTFTSGAMSHGALMAPAHEATAHGFNLVGALSNCGEGGEHHSRYGTIRASRIRQVASGRFGVWAGYLADPLLREVEIKIGQGAKPGEGGQLPGPKVSVEIAAARGATPGVELVSPPPHHDTYSIEDLAQLIHDCKAARVKVIVKLVSSEGIGTIAVGVAKAGADVINVAGNTGGTGAAAVTSLKHAGRAPELGLVEVHQALCANGLRSKVVLRASGAHQSAGDVIRSAMLGADSFEFGTSALMMLGCVMAKNCNIKCPAGITTNPEVFEGDPRALGHYLLNVAHGVREILAELGFRSLRQLRGRTDLLQLIDHPQLADGVDVRRLLHRQRELQVRDPVWKEPDFDMDQRWLEEVREILIRQGGEEVRIGPEQLGTWHRSTGARLAIDIERMLNYEPGSLTDLPAVMADDRGRRTFKPEAVRIETAGNAGQSYGAFCNDGMLLRHQGSCNDGVAKSACGGTVVVSGPGQGQDVLVGNFALFGATGGRLFVAGAAGDRFAVRNSGATAVVEGVGDFAVEYMTGGVVVNLGVAGHGFGTGMSGGMAYQYDPDGTFVPAARGLMPVRITEASDWSGIHLDTVRQLLGEHVAYTGSRFAQQILENFDTQARHFIALQPAALLEYLDVELIREQGARKAFLDELSHHLVSQQVRSVKTHYRSGTPVQQGRIPAETDSASMFALLGDFLVLQTAQRLAMSRLPGDPQVGDPAVTSGARNLILTEDHFLIQQLRSAARKALAGHDDAALAAMVAGKRVQEYRDSLWLRNVRAVDIPGIQNLLTHLADKAGFNPGADYAELFVGHSLERS